MKRSSDLRLFAFVLGAGLAMSACSLPGMSLKSHPTNQGNQHAGKYTVQPITPALLRRQSEAQERKAAGLPNPELSKSVADYTYTVEPQDVLSVVVWGHPEFSPTGSSAQGLTGGGGSASTGTVAVQDADQPPGQSGFTVQADGNIFFPYVGDLEVAGLTTPEIRKKLTTALSKYLVNPQVSVSVTGFHSQTYQLAGSVEKPGLYSITNVPVTVSQAIQIAGGILQTVPNITVASKASAQPLADLAHVVYIHKGQRHILNLRAFFLRGDESQDRLLHPGDIVQVPDNSFDQVHLIGEVRQPGNYPLDNGQLNLAQAIGDAGGLDLVTANPSRIFVFRGAYDKPKIFWLDAGSPDAMLLATQFDLQPQDVVFVATAGISTWNRIITQILPTVQTLYETKVLLNK